MLQRDWLSLRPEEAIEPDIDICDPHHHLWAQPTGRFPRYDLDDLRIDTGAGHRVVDTVFIDCASSYRTAGPHHLRPVGETEFVAERAATSEATPGARIAGIVGHADLDRGAAVEEVLGAHLAAGGGRFRGIRHSAAWDADPSIARSLANPPTDLYRRPSFREGLTTLGRMGLSFDAWQYHPQLPDLVDLARAHPDVPIVVNHLGAPLGVGRYAGQRHEVLAAWRSAMAELAHLDNVWVKVGGIGMPRYGMGWEDGERPPSSNDVVAAWGDEMRWCIDTFGPSRCMFESNYPVDGESCSYVVLWNAFKKVSASYGPAERHDLFAATARRFYRLAG
jgi:predicted TIM-barrel fold metal-dependent hydrolase